MYRHRAWSLVEEVAAHRPERGKRYTPELRERIIAYAADRHAEGVSWESIAAELGMSTETLRGWRTADDGSSRAMVPVRVVPDAEVISVRVVSPGGHRIEGLTLDDAVYVLRALG
jgi:transposase-like protein